MTFVALLWITILFVPHFISAIEETLWKADFDKAKVNHHNTRLCVYIRNEEKCVTREKAPGDPKEVAKLFNLVHSIVDVDDITVTPGPDNRDDPNTEPSEKDKGNKQPLDLTNYRLFSWETPRPPPEKTLYDRILQKLREKEDAELKKRWHVTATENPRDTVNENSKEDSNKSQDTIGKFEINIKAILEVKRIKSEKHHTKVKPEKATDAQNNNHTVIIVLKDLDGQDLGEKENISSIDIKNQPEATTTAIKVDSDGKKESTDAQDNNNTVIIVLKDLDEQDLGAKENEPEDIKTDEHSEINTIDQQINNNTTNDEVDKTRDNTDNVSNVKNMSTSYEYTYEYYSVSDENQGNVGETVRSQNKYKSAHKTQKNTAKLLKFKKIRFLSGQKEKLEKLINNYYN